MTAHHAPTSSTNRAEGTPLLVQHYDALDSLLARASSFAQPVGDFQPPWSMPIRSDRLERFLAPSAVSIREMPTREGHPLSLLDLRGDPTTRTTKTTASLLMVARAVRHIADTGEPIAIVTPSSANKATALRSAVLRAIDVGLVRPEQLQIISVVPSEATPKLWSSRLDEEPELLRRNPVVVHRGHQRVSVKDLVKQFAHDSSVDVELETGVRLWFTLDLANYAAADALRAYVERDTLGDGPRWHAHSVSSAFGLLGHDLGVQTLGTRCLPGYLLVQHLDTPDMVLHLIKGTFDRSALPAYERGPDGVFRQDQSPHFPATTLDPDEVLDPTFYTHQPPTQPRMEELIRRQGGNGVVVSLDECLVRYSATRSYLRAAGIDVPADPRALREWSLVMAMTGVAVAIDRGLVPAKMPVLVHGSGSYSDTDYEPLRADRTSTLQDTDLRSVVAHAINR